MNSGRDEEVVGGAETSGELRSSNAEQMMKMVR